MIFGTEQRQAEAKRTPKRPGHIEGGTGVLMVGTIVGTGAEEVEEEETKEEVTNKAVDYEGGFTEDTQVKIFDQAQAKNSKRRVGLGSGKMSKSNRRDAAKQDHKLLKEGSYLARKFVHFGNLSDYNRQFEERKLAERAAAKA